MLDISTICKVLAFLVLFHLLIKLLLAAVLGIRVGVIDPFRLKVSSIEFKNKAFDLKIKSLKLKISPFYKFNKFCTLRFDNVDIQIHAKKVIGNSKKEDSTDRGISNNLGEDPYEVLDLDRAISIYSGNYKLNFILKSLVKYFPSIAISLRNVNINFEGLELRSRDLDFKIDAATVSKQNFKQNIKDSVALWYSDLTLVELTSTYGTHFSPLLKRAKFHVGCRIDLKKGELSDFVLKVKLDDVTVPIMSILHTIKNLKNKDWIPKSSLGEKDHYDDDVTSSDASSVINEEINHLLSKKRIYTSSLIFRVFRQASLSISGLSVTNIPIMTQSELDNTLAQNHNPPNAIFANIHVASYEMSMAKIFSNQAGFDLDFSKTDKPFQVSLAILDLRLAINFDYFQGFKSDIKSYEIISISGITSSMRSDMIFQVLRFMSDSNQLVQPNLISTVGLISIHCCVSGLTLDLSCEQLGMLISKFKDISNERTVAKLEKRTKTEFSDDFNDDDDNVEVVKKTGDSIKKTLPKQVRYIVEILELVWPRIHLKLLIEKPSLVLKHIDETKNLKHILLLNPSLLNIDLKGVSNVEKNYKKYLFESKVDISSCNLHYVEDPYVVGLHQSDVQNAQSHIRERVLNVRNVQFFLSAQLSPAPLLNINTEIDGCKLRLGTLAVVKGLEKILQYVVHSFNPRADLEDLKEKYVQLFPKNVNREVLSVIFQDLPPWFEHLTFKVDEVSLVMMSRSIFMSPDVVSDDTNTEEIIRDTINGKYRRIVMGFNEFSIKARNKRFDEKLSSNADEDDSSSAYVASSLDVTPANCFWNVTVRLNRSFGKLLYEDDSRVDSYPLKMKSFLFFDIPSIELLIGALEDDRKKDPKHKILVNLGIESINLVYSLKTQFMIFSFLFLIKQTVLKPLFSKGKPKGQPIEKQENQSTRSSSRTLKDVFKFSANIKEAMITLNLANDVNMRLDLFNTDAEFSLNKPIEITSSVIRLNVQSPTVPGYWTHLLLLQRSKISVNLDKNKPKSDNKVTVINHDIRIIVPNQFIVYHIFESITILVKLLKQMQYNLLHDDQELVVLPSVKKPIELPTIELKSKSTVMNLEDDSFEVELGMIYQLGLIEQRARLEKTKEMEKSIHQFCKSSSLSKDNETRLSRILERGYNSFNFSTPQLSGNTLKGKSSLNKLQVPQSAASKLRSFTDSGSPSSIHSLEEEKIVNEYERKTYLLKANFSKSWIKLIKEFKEKKQEVISDNLAFLKGVAYNLPISKVFNENLLSSSENPPLMGIYLKHLNCTVKHPTFDLDDLPQYLHKVGKGMPLDTDYSLLVPFYLDLKVRELRVHLRDYPLPMVYVPTPSERFGTKAPCFKVSGDIVICEQYSDSDEQLRWIDVPFFKTQIENDKNDYYSFSIPSTLMSVKTFAQLEADICSDEPTKVTWGASYAAVLRQLSINFDSFSKPVLDPSKKLGIWDKMRSIMHGNLKLISTNNGELRINIKGSMDPYKVLGYASGFSLCFKKELEVFINKSDDSKDFLVFNAKEVLFVIPNHLSEVLPVWNSDTPLFLPRSRESELITDGKQDEDDDSDVISPLISTSLYGIYLNQKYEVKEEDFEMIDNSSDYWYDKINIKLKGFIQFKVAFYFQRNISRDSGERTDEFIPHYDIKLKNPKYVEDVSTYDAYEGFRSNYIHMSFELMSPKKESSDISNNALYLSPESLIHFFKWWTLFGNGISLPIRKGNLFEGSPESISFGTHLFTNKFLFLVEPLYLFFGYRMDAVDVSTIGAIGLKGKISNFSVDLHQRKQLMIKKNEKLDRTIKLMKMQMYLAKIIFEGIDIRGVEAVFDGSKLQDHATAPVHDDVESSKLSITDYKIFDDDLSWFDDLDFEERGLPNVLGLSSSCQCHPLLFAPRITYLKSTDNPDYVQYDPFFPDSDDIVPFGNEASHNCIIEDDKEDEEERNKAASVFKRDADDNHLEANLNDIDTNYDNVFLLESILLKWNVQSRDFVMAFIDELVFRRSRSYHNYKSLSLITKNHGNNDKSDVSDQSDDEKNGAQNGGNVFTKTTLSCEEHIKNFSKELRKISYDLTDKFLIARNDFLVKLKSPQIQLILNDESEFCVLLKTPNINLDIISIKETTEEAAAEEGKMNKPGEHRIRGMSKSLVEPTVETRFGAFLKDTNLYVIYKKDVLNEEGLLNPWIEESNYGATSNWPPFLPYSVTDEKYERVLDSFKILSDTSIVVRYNSFSDVLTHFRNNLVLDVSDFDINVDSKQYFAFYSLVFNLLMNGEEQTDDDHKKVTGVSANRIEKLNEALEKLALVTDFDDLSAVVETVQAMLDSSPALSMVRDDIQFRKSMWNEQDFKLDKLLRTYRSKLFTELYLIIKTVIGGYQKTDTALEMLVRADNIKINMIEENKAILLEMQISDGKFRRLQNADGSNDNLLQVGSLLIFNKDDDVLYPELLSLFDDPKLDKSGKKKRKLTMGNIENIDDDIHENMINVTWSTERPVGGIKMLKAFDMVCDPLKVSLEEKTGVKILEYLFPDGKAPGLGDSSMKSDLDDNDDASDDGESEDEDGDVNQTRSDDSSDEISIAGNMKSKQIDEMVDRASNYFVISSMKLFDLVLCVSFHGTGMKRLINVTDFVLRLPTLVIRNKTWTAVELIENLKNFLIKSLLKHTGSLLGNKLKIRKKKVRVSLKDRLKKISN